MTEGDQLRTIHAAVLRITKPLDLQFGLSVPSTNAGHWSGWVASKDKSIRGGSPTTMVVLGSLDTDQVTAYFMHLVFSWLRENSA